MICVSVCMTAQNMFAGSATRIFKVGLENNHKMAKA